jgi:ATPase subunit of ABC transporter with duplicated ATPase domains
MIVASNIAIQFGAKPLFSNVTVKFGGGNRYGLIGANGCGKSTFMKILGAEHERQDTVREGWFRHGCLVSSSWSSFVSAV